MTYVILVNDDDSLYASKKEPLMQRSKLMNTLVFMANPIHNGIDMTDATVVLEYLLPASKKYMTEILTLSEERYKNCYLQYKLPFDTKLSSESGEVELQLTFIKTELDENGVGIQRVRKIAPTKITITPIVAWADIIPDSALSPLDERLIKLDAQMRAMDNYLDVIDGTKVDNLVYNHKEESLQLSANGVPIGNKVSIRDILDDGVPVINLNNSGSNNKPNDNNCNCNCNCEDNVVEFGYFPEEIPKEEDDDNVVEF